MATKEEIEHWLFRNARSAVVAELADLREVAVSSRTTKPEVAAKVADCQHAINRLLSPLSDDESLVEKVDTKLSKLEARIEQIESSLSNQMEKTKCKK